MKKKENKIDWMPIMYYFLIGMLAIMVGFFAARERWIDVLCNLLWMFCSILMVRNYLNLQKLKDVIEVQDRIISFLSPLAEKHIQEENETKKTSAEVNEETEMVHVGEGVGDE